MDYNVVKNSLFFRLWNRESFREYEGLLPHQYFGDLVITCLIDLKELTGMPGVAHCTHSVVEEFRITEEQLFQDAFASAPRLKPFHTETVEEAIQRIQGGEYEETEGPLLHVLTTQEGPFGASAILYPGVLESVAQGRNLLLIPSSVHEFLYLEDDGQRVPLWIEQILRSVNKEEVGPGEILSDHLYYYDAQNRKMCMIRIENKMAV